MSAKFGQIYLSTEFVIWVYSFDMRQWYLTLIFSYPYGKTKLDVCVCMCVCVYMSAYMCKILLCLTNIRSFANMLIKDVDI